MLINPPLLLIFQMPEDAAKKVTLSLQHSTPKSRSLLHELEKCSQFCVDNFRETYTLYPERVHARQSRRAKFDSGGQILLVRTTNC